MIRRLARLVLGALASISLLCPAQKYCEHTNDPQPAGFNPPILTAPEIVRILTDNAGLESDFNFREVVTDQELSAQGAVAQMCRRDERWIFYDPAFIRQIGAKDRTNWPQYFIFAHEVAHHFNNDILARHIEQELKADRTAARWLTRMDATVYDLVGSIKSFVMNENRVEDHPGRCERVAGVILAYDDEAEKLNRAGSKKPLYDVSNCDAVPRALDGGLYPTRLLEAGARLQAGDVQKFGTPAANADLPIEFSRDVLGMCAVARLNKSERLTWSNIGACALMHQH